jgi:hypothetical protein
MTTLWDPYTTFAIPKTATCMRTSNTNQPCPNRLSAAQSWARAAHLEALARKEIFSVTKQGLRDLLKEALCEEHQGRVDGLVEDVF